jgi:hypothetical protein
MPNAESVIFCGIETCQSAGIARMHASSRASQQDCCPVMDPGRRILFPSHVGNHTLRLMFLRLPARSRQCRHKRPMPCLPKVLLRPDSILACATERIASSCLCTDDTRGRLQPYSCPPINGVEAEQVSGFFSSAQAESERRGACYRRGRRESGRPRRSARGGRGIHDPDRSFRHLFCTPCSPPRRGPVRPRRCRWSR